MASSGRTEVQYGSSAAMCLSSDSLKMPFLKTSLESLAPMLAMLNERFASSFQVRYDVVPCSARSVEAGVRVEIFDWQAG